MSNDVFFNVPNKIQLSNLDEYDHKFLLIVGMIHKLGALKHGAYNWENDPVHTDSTIGNNLSAMFRHFAMIKEGRYMDPSGTPHLFHLVCRASMLLYTQIKNYKKDKPYELDPKIKMMDATTQPESGICYVPVETALTLAAAHDFNVRQNVDLAWYSRFLMMVLSTYLTGGEEALLNDTPCIVSKDSKSSCCSLIDTLFFMTRWFMEHDWKIHIDEYTTHTTLNDLCIIDGNSIFGEGFSDPYPDVTMKHNEIQSQITETVQLIPEVSSEELKEQYTSGDDQDYSLDSIKEYLAREIDASTIVNPLELVPEGKRGKKKTK